MHIAVSGILWVILVIIHFTKSTSATGAVRATLVVCPGSLHVPVIFIVGVPVYPRPGEVIFTPLTVLFALRVIVAVAVSVGAVIFSVGRVVQLPSNMTSVTIPFLITVRAERPPLHVPLVDIIRGGNSYHDPQLVIVIVHGMFSFFIVGSAAAALFVR